MDKKEFIKQYLPSSCGGEKYYDAFFLKDLDILIQQAKEDCAKIAKQIKQSHIDGTAPIQLYDDQFEFACELIDKAIRE